MSKTQLIEAILQLKPHLDKSNLAMLSREHLEEILAAASE